MTDIIERLSDYYNEPIKVEEVPIMQSLIVGLIKFYNIKKGD